MAKNTRPRGKCAFCGREMTRGGMARHLRACPERKAAIQDADHKSGKAQKLYDAYGVPMPIVNSPRVGMCGYTGPAEPPY